MAEEIPPITEERRQEVAKLLRDHVVMAHNTDAAIKNVMMENATYIAGMQSNDQEKLESLGIAPEEAAIFQVRNPSFSDEKSWDVANILRTAGAHTVLDLGDDFEDVGGFDIDSLLYGPQEEGTVTNALPNKTQALPSR